MLATFIFSKTSGTFSGLPEAQYNLGQKYLCGALADKNPAQAADWFQQAATRGYAPAQCALADLHDLGVGVAKDSVLTAFWNQKASEQGYVPALRKFYQEGHEP